MTQEQALDLAIRCLCRATLFTAAQALCTSRPQQTVTTSHLLTTSLDPGLVEAQASCADFLADCRAQLRAQVPRIVELRRRAVEDPLAFYEGEVAMDLPDNVSVAASSRLSTSNSLFTRYGSGRGPASLAPTGMTGKFSMSSSRVAARQRRREEKKRARGRKGTVYEEEYLVGSVRRLLDRVNSATATSTSTSPSASASIGGGIPSGEVRRLIEALVRRGMRDRAVAIETLAVELVRECAAAVAEIWPAATAASKEQDQTTQDADNGGDTTGVQVEGNGELDGMLRARENQIPPLVPRFERLSLLGET